MASSELGHLPETFSYSQAMAVGMSERRLYALRDAGRITQLGRGLFRDAGADIADHDLLEIAHRVPRATLCLTTALARHGLTDEIPSRIDVALPRGQRAPRTTAPVAWHSFNKETFEIGRDLLPLTDEVTIGIYNSERCIIDAFRLQHLIGPDVAIEALKRWLRERGTAPSALLSMAADFPKALPSLRTALEVLL